MLRNKEILLLLTVSLVIIFIGSIIGFLFSTITGILVLSTGVLFMIIILLFTRYRYRKIAQLSHFLRQIVSGDYTLDVRDNYEGELSILKNEIYKVTMMLSEHKSHLEKDKQKLTDAISDISHQLKTPLTSMMVMADLLSDGTLSEEKRQEFTHNIQVQLDRIEWLVSSLLKFSKIDAGTTTFKKEKVNVPKLLSKVVQPLLIPLEIKEQKLEWSGDEHTTFIGDENWTSEAILNILKNCMEHTPEHGKINIHYSKNTLFTEIVIKDNGKGIPKEDLPHIFKRFYKGKNAKEGSIGIGLAMAYQIITSQNGDIEVTSTPSTGTTFSIKFY